MLILAYTTLILEEILPTTKERAIMPLIPKKDTKTIVTPERGRPADPKSSAKRVIEKQRAILKMATAATPPATQKPKQDKGFSKPTATVDQAAKRTKLFTQALMEAEQEAPAPPKQEQKPVAAISVSQVVPQQQASGALSLSSVVDKPQTFAQQVAKPKAISITALRDQYASPSSFLPFRRG